EAWPGPTAERSPRLLCRRWPGAKLFATGRLFGRPAAWRSPRRALQPSYLADAEQPVRPDDQHRDDEDEDSRLCPRHAEKDFGEGLEQADQEPRHQRSANAAKAAEYRHDQGLDHRVEARVGIQEERW